MPCSHSHASLPPTDRLQVLREVPWMAKLAKPTFAILVEAAKEKLYKQGEYLVRQGDLDDSVYLVVRGIVQIVEEYADGSEEVCAADHSSNSMHRSNFVNVLSRKEAPASSCRCV
eukprot:904710-Prymnesium_polylepis.1